MIEISYFTAKSYEALCECEVFIIVQIASYGLVSGEPFFVL